MGDLIYFCKAEAKYFKLIKEALDSFQMWFNLKANHAKSNIFLSEVSCEEKTNLCGIFNFEIGTLPFKYLRMPKVSTKLNKENCKLFLKGILGRITSWKSKSLVYVGRLILFKVIFFSIQIYWSTIFYASFQDS